MDGKETPITKYLANLERRKSVFGAHANVSPSPSPPSHVFAYPSTTRRPTASASLKINFDDTFFSQDDESILNISPQQNEERTGIKRRRTSFIFDESTNVEALQKKISELEKLLIQTQTELIDGRAKYTSLDQLNIDMRRTHSEKMIAYDKTQEELRLKCKNATERAESLEKQLLKIQSKDSDRGRDFQVSATQHLNKIAHLESTVAELLKDKQDMSEKYTTDSINYEKEIQSLKTRVENAEKQSSKCTHEVEVAQSQLNDLRVKLQNTESELSEATEVIKKHDELRTAYEATRSEQENTNSDVLLLKEKLRKVENLYVKEQLTAQNMAKAMQKIKDENKILMSTVQREHILEEQILSAETEISGLQLQLRDKSAIEGERNNLRSEIKAWINIASKLDVNCRTPFAFETLYRKNHDMLLELKLENSNLKNENASITGLLKLAKSDIDKLKHELKAIHDEKQKLDFNLKKSLRRMNLIVQDRDGLRDLKESYEKEFDGMISEPLKARIAQLESIVSEYEVAIAEDPSLRKECEDCKIHTSSIESLKSELSGLTEEKEKLSQTLAEFNTTITEDPTTGLKIVSFGNNPSMLSIEARLKECISENDSLKAKLRRYEEDTMIRAPDEDLLKEKSDLEEKYKVLERKHEILTDSYDFESVQLQNACSKLFGYYVVLTRGGNESPNQFRLQSVYAPPSGEEDTFIFQEGDSGEMFVLDTPIIAHFQDEIERYLRQECSVSGFLAAVTLSYLVNSQQQSMSNIQDPNDGFDESGNLTTIQVLNTEFLGSNFNLPHTSTSVRREIEIEVRNQDDDDDDEEEEDEEEDEDRRGVRRQGESESDNGDYEEEQEEEPYYDNDDDGHENYDKENMPDDEDDDDDVVMLD